MQAADKISPPWGVFRRAALVVAVVLAAADFAWAAVLPPSACAFDHCAEVTVEPADTSIYVGSVNLAMQPLTRSAGVYRTDYVVKVFPFFFYDERGSMAIEVSDGQLQQLERGETVSFSGHASNSNGKERRIEGRATPEAAGANHGKIKVRVWVSKHIELVFNSVYRFTGKD